MSAPTYAGFLRAYTRALCFGKKHGMVAMAVEASNKNYRLREPLLCLAVEANCVPFLLKNCSEELRDDYEKVLRMYGEANFANAVRDEGSRIPYEYKKVWIAYENRRNTLIRENDVKEVARQKILTIVKEGRVTVPEISAMCKTQKSNVYAWLANGDSSRVGYETASNLLWAARQLTKNNN